MNEKEGVTEEIQARLYLNLYLSQYKRGWKHTAIYLLKGRANEPDHEAFAFYTLDNQPKQAAHYLHNFTTILADNNLFQNQVYWIILSPINLIPHMIYCTKKQ
jgi:hypothetical protein